MTIRNNTRAVEETKTIHKPAHPHHVDLGMLGGTEQLLSFPRMSMGPLVIYLCHVRRNPSAGSILEFDVMMRRDPDRFLAALRQILLLA